MSPQPVAEPSAGANRADAGSRPPAVETYDSRLFDQPIRAVPESPDLPGQRTWTVQVLSEDRQQVLAEVRAQLTGQFGSQQLRPGSYVKDALLRQLADGAPRTESFTSTGADGGAVEGFTTQTDLGRLNARPHPPDDPQFPGQRVWEVTLETDDGEIASVRARFTGQLTEADALGPNAYIKGALLRQLAADSVARAAELDKQIEQSWIPTAIVIAARDDPVEGTLAFDWRSGELTRFTNVEKGSQGGGPLTALQSNTVARWSSKLPDNVSIDMIQANTFRPFGADGAKEVTRRDYGISIALDGKYATVSANIRGGDFNLRSLEDGASVTVTVEGKAALTALGAEGLQRVGGSRVDLAALMLEQTGLAIEKSIGGSAGLAYQGKAYFDEQTEQVILDINGIEMPLGDFFDAFQRASERLEPINHGHPEIARANDRQALVNGENPYTRAVNNRASDPGALGTEPSRGIFVSHGSVSVDIANRLLWLSEQTGIDTGEAEHVLYNEQVGEALSRLIERNELTPVSPEYRHLVEEYRTDDKPWLDPLTPYQSAYLEDTLAVLERFGIADLFGPRVAAAAEQAAGERGEVPPPSDGEKAFVQDVFEGRFREVALADQRNALENFNQMIANFTGLRASLGLSLGDYAAETIRNQADRMAEALGERVGGVTTEEVVLAEALKSRLNQQHDGVLESLYIDTAIAESDQERRSLETFAALKLVDELRDPDADRVEGHALYAAFLELSPSERLDLGQRILAQWPD